MDDVADWIVLGLLLLGISLMVMLMQRSITETDTARSETSTKLETISADYDSVFDSITYLLSQKGFAIISADRDSGIINTEWKEFTRYESKINVIVRPKNENSTEIQLLILQKVCEPLHCYEREPGRSVYQEWFEDIRSTIMNRNSSL